MNPRQPARRVDDRRRDLARRARRWTVEQFHDLLAAEGVRRLFIVCENGELTLSHPRILAPVKAFFELCQDFAQHEGVFIGREDGIPTLFFAFVHDTRRGLAQGGLRFDRYDNVAQVLVDGLRLSQGMTRKNALAGLWWGGGKGIIPVTPAIDQADYLTIPDSDADLREPRRRLFRAYGRFIASLGGVYYTAEDIGTNTPDLNAVLACNRFTTCISSELGGSGNPSPFTAWGVYRAMEAAWLFLTGSRDLSGVRVAVQGAGHVGAPLIELLDDAGAEVWLCDTRESAIRRITERLPRVRVVEPEAIYAQEVDVFAPCAIGATVNAETIPRFAGRLRLVCGAANNILREPADAERLRERGIAFVPDFVCNRMGITNCADEWLGYLSEDIQVAAERVFPDSLRVLKHARSLAITTTEAAEQLADIAASELHPQLGHRGRRLIDHLIASRWHRDGERPEVRIAGRPFEPVLHEPDIRLAWERAQRYRGRGRRIAAAPITTAARPNLATVFSATLMDVKARAVEVLRGETEEENRPRRVLGSDHGGLALQLAVERAIPNERDEVGRPQLVEMCRDLHHRNDAAIREQLHRLGVGFDPQAWLDPMSGDGPRICERLFHALVDAGVVARENRHAHRCPHCKTILMDPEVVATELVADRKYQIRFRTRERGAEIETFTFDPALVLGMVAVAVRADGAYGGLAGQTVRPPSGGADVPVIAVPHLTADAEFVVPSHSRQDYRIAHRHGIEDHPVVYGDDGQVLFADGDRRPPEEARELLLERLGDAVSREQGRWMVDAHRCRRCEEVVQPSFSPQLYVRFDAARTTLCQKIDNGSVRFSHDRWRRRALDYLSELEPWCISRQIWWGNPIPTRPDEVLSTWFSLAAWSLQGAGWPGDPAPAPIEEVFTDPDLLYRWVIPSQLVSLQVTGRPVFRRVQVHGSVHVVERRRAERPGAPGSEPDEDRFLFRTVRRPMRRRLGNVVEPATLIRRFGADALRLGLLLCLGSGFQTQAVASETRFRRARRALHRFVSKLDGLLALAADPKRCGEPRLADRWIVAKCAAAAFEVRSAYEESRLADAAELLLGALEAYARYANVAAERRREVGDLGAILSASAAVVRRLREHFSPLCPFVFKRLEDWMAKRLPEGAEEPPVEAGLPERVAAIAAGRAAEPSEASDAALLYRREGDREELARLAGLPAATLPPYGDSGSPSAERSSP